MPWTYNQTTGEMALDGVAIGTGYSGLGGGLDNPAMQNVPDTGPIPEGDYTIGASFTHPQKGPIAMDLEPDPANAMFGRSEFMIHGDNHLLNHTASHGCIILSRDLRAQIAASGDDQLTVVS